MQNKDLKEVFSDIEIQIAYFKKSINARFQLYKCLERVKKDNWQSNFTPRKISESACNQTSLTNKNIIVLFNLEILDCLINSGNVDPNRVTFISNNYEKNKWAEKLLKVNTLQFQYEKDDSKSNYDNVLKLIENNFMNIDLCIFNPPYKMEDIKLLIELFGSCKEFVVVHPSTWIIDQKRKNRDFVKLRNLVRGHIVSLEFFNGNHPDSFNIDQFVPCVITHIQKNYNGPVKVRWFDDEEFEVEDIDDISVFGKKWFDLNISKFKNLLLTFNENNQKSIWENKLPKTATWDDSKFFVTLPEIRGNDNKSNKTSNNFVDVDFYTFFKEPLSDHFSKNYFTPNRASYCFNTKKEQENFAKYLKTDFARFCLAIYKVNSQLTRGETDLIPWLDFTKEWDDEKLFAKFNVSEELQEFIREFLPDYYNIR